MAAAWMTLTTANISMLHMGDKMNQKVTWLVLCLVAIGCSSFVSYNIGYRNGDRACRDELITMLDGLRMQCWEDVGEVKAQWKEMEIAELKKGLPEWAKWDDVKGKLEEIGAYGLDGKIYTRDNRRVIFRKVVNTGVPQIAEEERLAIEKLEADGNYVIVVGQRIPNIP